MSEWTSRSAMLRDGRFEIETVDVGAPAAGEVILEIAACGLCGTDHSLWRSHDLPQGTILGHEFAGTVVAVGAGVREWEVGDPAAVIPFPFCGRCELCAADRPNLCREALAEMVGAGRRPGALTERMRLPVSQLRAIPHGHDPTAYALVEPLAVALAAIDLGSITAGTRVGVIGLGPLGLFAALIARERGALVFGMDALPTRVQCAHGLGLGAFIADDRADERIRDLTLGGPEVVIEASGKRDAIDRAGAIARLGGRVVMVASYHAPSEIQPGHWLERGISLLPSIAYTPRQFEEALAMVAEGGLDIGSLITGVHGLDEVSEVFDSFETQTDQIKLLIAPSQGNPPGECTD